MSPRPKQTSMARSAMSERRSTRSNPQHVSRSTLGSASTSTSYPSDMSDYSVHLNSDTMRNDEPLVWNGTYSGYYSGHDDAHFDSMHMNAKPIPDHSYMMPVMSGPHYYSTPMFDQFPQGPMSQTLTGPLLESPFQDAMTAEDVLLASPVSMDFPGYDHTSHHTWRHGQLSPPADIFHPELDDFSMEAACDVPFQSLPESAISGTFTYDKVSTSPSRYGQPRPIRSASEKSHKTMAPQDIYYSRSDRADKVKARSDPRYEISPDKDGYFHCPMLGDGTCNHKPTKQKCIYAKYLDSHLKPYVCTHGDKDSECDGARFSSNACLFRHEREAHGMHNHGLNPYVCLFHGCERSRQGNGFPRRWNQRDHMKRVHDWEEPETSGYDQDRNGLSDSVKRRKTGNPHAVPMKRSTSSHAKAQAATYSHGSRQGVSMSRYATQAEKQLQATMIGGYPMQFDDVQFSQVSGYSQQPRTSDAYPSPYLVAY